MKLWKDVFMSDAESLLDPAFVQKSERLTLAARRSFAGSAQGVRRSMRRGGSLEFADYREYAPGDDLRAVDWNMAARSDRMFVKLFTGEENLFVALLLDTSRSMDWGAPRKLRYAAQSGAALGCIGLRGSDRVTVQPYAGGANKPLPAQQGRTGARPLLAYLDALQSSKTDSTTGSRAGSRTGEFADDLRRFAATTKQRGGAIVLSDFLDASWQDGLNALCARGFEVIALHILAPDEIEPALSGELRLLDSESGAIRDISITPALLARYRQNFTRYCGEIQMFCLRRNITHLRISTKTPFEATAWNILRRSAITR